MANLIHIDQRRTAVAKWLFFCCAMVFSMVILGGVTRLTGSGLSMVDWRPIMGIIPPIGIDQWQLTFEMYKQSPEFIVKNYNMDLEGFKGIFWLEYLHRVLGRLIGIVFFVPMLYFMIRGYIQKYEIPKYLLMLILGGMQGLLGWYMVQSGLVNNPAVSQYRLTAHLSSAFLIYGFMFWVALSLIYPDREKPSKWSKITFGLTMLIVLTIISGGFVAGLKAGKVFATNRGGALVRVEGLRGFIPGSHISTRKAKEELVADFLPLKFLEVDEERNRLVLSHRRALVERKMNRLEVGEVVVGAVRGIKPYGAFIDIGGVSGLLHISEISHEHIETPHSVLNVNDQMKVMIIDLDAERGRISLSTKALEPEPGDMLTDPQKVFDKAEEMAARYKQMLLEQAEEGEDPIAVMTI